MTDFKSIARGRQEHFRQTSSTISVDGRSPSDEQGKRHGHLLALGYEEENLYPGIRGENGALGFFRDRKIDWHKGGRKGSSGTKEPTGNMLSSQIACVNFLLPLVAVNGALDAIARAIDDDVEGIVNIRDEDKSSPIEFEWIGLGNSLEGKDTRGSNTTSVDAFMIARTKASHLRAYLMEWKYTESYTVGKYKGTGKSGEVI